MEPWILLAGLGLQTLIFLAGGYGMVLRGGWSAASLEKQLASMQEELKQLNKVITAQAVHTNRLDNQGTQIAVLQKEVSDLRRGVGWKIDRGRPGIDGEYP
jgi:hypothetical protein